MEKEFIATTPTDRCYLTSKTSIHNIQGETKLYELHFSTKLQNTDKIEDPRKLIENFYLDFCVRRNLTIFIGKNKKCVVNFPLSYTLVLMQKRYQIHNIVLKLNDTFIYNKENLELIQELKANYIKIAADYSLIEAHDDLLKYVDYIFIPYSNELEQKISFLKEIIKDNYKVQIICNNIKTILAYENILKQKDILICSPYLGWDNIFAKYSYQRQSYLISRIKNYLYLFAALYNDNEKDTYILIEKILQNSAIITKLRYLMANDNLLNLNLEDFLNIFFLQTRKEYSKIIAIAACDSISNECILDFYHTQKKTSIYQIDVLNKFLTRAKFYELIIKELNIGENYERLAFLNGLFGLIHPFISANNEFRSLYVNRKNKLDILFSFTLQTLAKLFEYNHKKTLINLSKDLGLNYDRIIEIYERSIIFATETYEQLYKYHI